MQSYDKLTVDGVSTSGRQTPNSVWGAAGTTSAITCTVLNGLTYSNLSYVQYVFFMSRYIVIIDYTP